MRHSAPSRLFVIAGLLALSGCSKPATTPDATTSGNTTPGGNAAAVPDPAPAPPIVVAAGTTLSVTVDQSISSKTNNPGDHFNASLAAPVMVGEMQAIPAGARVVGTVTDAKSAGRFKGHAELGVTLNSITVNRETYSLKTSLVGEAGKGRGKRTAIGAGGGAAVGAIIGALAGGGKGAAIGAGAGAGAGTAGAAFTGNRDITINAETRLRFRLREPLEIRGN
jgi:hypothetical protein